MAQLRRHLCERFGGNIDSSLHSKSLSARPGTPVPSDDNSTTTPTRQHPLGFGIHAAWAYSATKDEVAAVESDQYARILWAHWKAVAIATLVGLVVAIAAILVMPKVYSANASGILQASQAASSGSPVVGDQLAQNRAKTYVTTAESRTVAQYVKDRLGLGDSLEELVSQVTVTNPTDSTVIKVTAKAGTPTSARDLAETWLDGIRADIQNLQTAATGTVDVKLYPNESAVLPTAPTSPNRKMYLALGLLVGAAVGIGYAFVRARLDRRIRSAESIEQDFELPVVGQIPLGPARAKGGNGRQAERLFAGLGSHKKLGRSRTGAEIAIAEGVRQLRTNIQFMNVDHPPRIIVVSSPMPGDGKSTVTANLAVAIAESGKRVVLVDGDLRKPTVADTFGLLPGIGLTDVLIGRAELRDVLQSWGESGNLLVLGAGSVPPNPSELLGSDLLHSLLKELAEDAIVIVDAPPLIAVTDATVLSTRTDGVLIVVSAGQTTVEGLEAATRNVQRASGKVLGVILNRVPLRGPDSPNYGYGYGRYGYGSYGDGDGHDPSDAEPALLAHHPHQHTGRTHPRRSQEPYQPTNPRDFQHVDVDGGGPEIGVS